MTGPARHSRGSLAVRRALRSRQPPLPGLYSTPRATFGRFAAAPFGERWRALPGWSTIAWTWQLPRPPFRLIVEHDRYIPVGIVDLGFVGQASHCPAVARLDHAAPQQPVGF